MGVYNVRNLSPSVREAVKTGGWQAFQKELIRPIQENPEFRNYIIMRHIQKQKKKNSGLGGVVKGAISKVAAVVAPVATLGAYASYAGYKQGTNYVRSQINMAKGLSKGNIQQAISNAANVGTSGMVDATGAGKGLINAPSMKIGASSSGGYSTYGVVSKRKGLLSQLRAGKGNIGGGSYTETVKNPLGGSAGRTGK